jgi:hypothetical protein
MNRGGFWVIVFLVGHWNFLARWISFESFSAPLSLLSTLLVPYPSHTKHVTCSRYHVVVIYTTSITANTWHVPGIMWLWSTLPRLPLTRDMLQVSCGCDLHYLDYSYLLYTQLLRTQLHASLLSRDCCQDDDVTANVTVVTCKLLRAVLPWLHVSY